MSKDIKGLIVIFFVALCGCQPATGQKNDELGPQTPLTPEGYSSMTVPKWMTFCGDTIDLSRFDRRERMDREILSFIYMHSASIQIIKRANRYFPTVERILAECGVPDDMKYLMVIESNVDPLAYSRAGAAGLWQFMQTTGREFGLTVNANVDERYHVEKSTRAACKYLKQAYTKYGDWASVAASYNAGQGKISKELKQQYADNALDLQLVEETTRYVYRILAAKLMMTRPQDFGFRLRASDLYPPIPYHEVKVTTAIADLAAYAKKQGITYALLRSMNPWIRGYMLPANSAGWTIRIPDNDGMRYNPRLIIPHDRNWVVE